MKKASAKVSERSTRPAIVLPTDAARELARHPAALAAFERLSYTSRRELVEGITTAKRTATRERRIARMIALLRSDRPATRPVNSTKPMITKMGIAAGTRILVLDADEAALASWRDLPEGCQLSLRPGRSPHDVVVLYPATAAALARRLHVALRACGSAGVLWVAYPKKSSGIATTLTRDTGWEPTQRKDMRAIAMIALDDIWAGVKFRLLPT
jgi:hypothetical protein